MSVSREKDTVFFINNLYFSELNSALVIIYKAINDRGYCDLNLDFSRARVVAPEFMLPLCDYLYEQRERGIVFSLIPPMDAKLAKLFFNANWSYYIDPVGFSKSEFKGFTQVPATLFTNASEQYDAVSKIVKVILSSLDGINREDFAAFEWAINEITDNVLVHASSNRGFVQVSKFHKKQKKISFIVCDLGVGIPTTLRSGLAHITSDAEALSEAVREGITRDKSVGQGNGLFGSFQVCSASGGSFTIRSGYGVLEAKGMNVSTKTVGVPYKGTIVVSEVDFSKPNLLSDALRFEGQKYKAWTRIESFYEDGDEDFLRVSIAEEGDSYRSRIAGMPLRQKIKNLITMHPQHLIVLDFDGVGVMSSSFADELLGKLALEIGQDEYLKKLKIINASALNFNIIGKAISQRFSNG